MTTPDELPLVNDREHDAQFSVGECCQHSKLGVAVQCRRAV
eukprot:SAG22_NODE_20155_length_268_cov_0.609467_1_plen_40_part_01